MKAKQAINLLENGIMPCILYSSTNGEGNIKESSSSNQYTIDYICGYNYQNFSEEKKFSNSSQYNFITLISGDYLSANDLDEEIFINNNEGGETIAK